MKAFELKSQASDFAGMTGEVSSVYDGGNEEEQAAARVAGIDPAYLFYVAVGGEEAVVVAAVFPCPECGKETYSTSAGKRGAAHYKRYRACGCGWDDFKADVFVPKADRGRHNDGHHHFYM